MKQIFAVLGVWVAASAGTGGAVDASNVGRLAYIGHYAVEARLRSSEYEASTDAADREREAAAVEKQRAATHRATDKPATLEHRKGDGATISKRGRGNQEPCDRGDERGAHCGYQSHGDRPSEY